MNVELTSKQIEQISGLKANTLHYYIQSGAIAPDIDSGRGRGTQRLFSSTNLMEAIIIRHLIDMGLSKKGIVQGLKSIQDAGERDKLTFASLSKVPTGFLVFTLGIDGLMLHRFIQFDDPDAFKKVWSFKAEDNTYLNYCSIVINLRSILTYYGARTIEHGLYRKEEE